MTLGEFKKNVCKEISKWCNGLPEDGDFTGVELVTDHWNERGDGDYAVVVLVHNYSDERDYAMKGEGDGR